MIHLAILDLTAFLVYPSSTAHLDRVQIYVLVKTLLMYIAILTFIPKLLNLYWLLTPSKLQRLREKKRFFFLLLIIKLSCSSNSFCQPRIVNMCHSYSSIWFLCIMGVETEVTSKCIVCVCVYFLQVFEQETGSFWCFVGQSDLRDLGIWKHGTFEWCTDDWLNGNKVTCFFARHYSGGINVSSQHSGTRFLS